MNHRYYYNYVNSTLINGLISEETIVVSDETPWWKTAIIALDAVIGLLTAAALILFCKNLSDKKNK